MQPAQTLAESELILKQTELAPSDHLYADLRRARGSKSLSKLEIFLRNAASAPNALAKVAFIGNRGSGKSTFLRHLEAMLQEEGLFTPLHVELDPSLKATAPIAICCSGW